MEKLAHLSLLQKNTRYVQNYRRLQEDILFYPVDGPELRRYLREEETVFYQEFCEHPEPLRRETEELRRLQEQGVQFTFPGDAFFPPAFQAMPGSPLLLSFRGHAPWLHQEGALAVVGSREPSSLSQVWMEEFLGEFLHHEKCVVVSGGARGVDQMAHQLALRRQVPTIAVLPSGLGHIYPHNFAAWQGRIVDGGGCLLSEYPYTQSMRKHYFHDRNRLIAGLGLVTLLVEARRRSGSLLTAQKALQLGKGVLVVPGHPCDHSHLGNLDLLSEGATPVRDAEDLRMYYRGELKTNSLLRAMASDLREEANLPIVSL